MSNFQKLFPRNKDVLMTKKLLHVGFSNYVVTDKIMAVMSPESAPVRRMVHVAKKDGQVLDLSHGRKTKSVIVLQNKLLLLSAVNTDKLAERFSRASGEEAE